MKTAPRPPVESAKVRSAASQPIPQPPQKPMIGNLLDIGTVTPVQDLMAMARRMGPIFQLSMMGKPFTVAWGQPFVDELCDEKRFEKSVQGGLAQVRKITHDALFTAYSSEPNWSKAHSILLPNFSDRAMASYHPMMLDVAEQFMLKWQRANSEDEFDVVRDMTALTLDTIALAGFGFRFNSFYRDENHPFVEAMVDALEVAMTTRGLPTDKLFGRGKRRRLARAVAYMNSIVDRIISERKAEHRADAAMPRRGDLLDHMLDGIDRKTGESLDDATIGNNIKTFLIAGHETTSGLLSFATYFLLQNPGVVARARAEVDAVLGSDISVAPTYRQVARLTYVRQILKESLRLWPTAPGFTVRPLSDEVLGGRYFLKARSHVLLLLPMLHRDPDVWTDPERFDPDRFTPEREAALPPNAYKPFGNGQRACIGQQFAMQEATLVMGMLLQRFNLVDHRKYALRVKETLTIKPEGLKIKVRRREHAQAAIPAARPAAQNGAPQPGNGAREPVDAAVLRKHGTPLLVLFGSNLGTSEDIARHVAESASAQGFAVTLGWMDDYVGKLPTSGALIIVTASYNGTPPDNAAAFCKWLSEGLPDSALSGVKYAVFGAGNRNWASTYQAIPRLVDERLAAYGAERIYARGEGDARDDLDAHFLSWKQPLWNSLAEALGLELGTEQAAPERPMYELEFVAGPQPNPLAQAHGATTMRVIVNRELQTRETRSTRHIEVALPAGMQYRAGDHLGVIPSNSEALVDRVLRRFGLEPNAYVRLRASGPQRIASLPLDATLSLRRLLMHYVELQHVATRKQIATLAECTQCPQTKPRLLELAADGADTEVYKTEVKAKRASVLDLLERFPACELGIASYIEMLPLMTPRYYSISSSPQASPDRCSMTVGVVRGEALSGNGIYEGVATNHLLRRDTGSRINAFVKESKSGFRLPEDPSLPIVMVGPGTGLAPFRGFLQERQILRARGARLGPAMLFFGCRHPDEDYIYRNELERFADEGIVDLHVAFSRLGGSRTYVQDLIARQADRVGAALDAGGTVYVCGDGSAMEPAVRATFVDMFRARTATEESEAQAWLADLVATNRYVLDVWANA